MKLDIEPCWSFIGNTVKDQLFCVVQETCEVMHAFKHESQERLISEIMDVIGVCVTTLTILGLGQKEIDKAIEDMHKKNSTNGRDYYTREDGK